VLGPRGVRVATGIGGSRRAQAVIVGMRESQVTGHSPLPPRTANQDGAGFEPLSLRHETGSPTCGSAHGTARGSADHDRSFAELVTEQRRHRNHPDGFWVASTDPAAAQHALTGTVPRGGLLDWPGFLDAIAEQGPDTIIQQVRAAEASDPDGQRWPRGKRHDDASAAFCHLTQLRPGARDELQAALAAGASFSTKVTHLTSARALVARSSAWNDRPSTCSAFFTSRGARQVSRR
jgi:hypothetical protein